MSEKETFDFLMKSIKTEVEKRFCTFKESNELVYQVSKMAKWLTSEDIHFGAFLCGGLGNGKTTMMRAVQRLIATLEVKNSSGEGCVLYIRDSTSILELSKNEKDFGDLCRVPMLGIDDLGQEPKEYLVYGNVHTPLVKLLSARYDGRLFTMITSNLTPAEICERYGKRIGDRLNEMMEVIDYTNLSFRSGI